MANNAIHNAFNEECNVRQDIGDLVCTIQGEAFPIKTLCKNPSWILTDLHIHSIFLIETDKTTKKASTLTKSRLSKFINTLRGKSEKKKKKNSAN